MCNNTIIENKKCQTTSKCMKCVMRNSLYKVLINKEEKWIKGLEFNSDGKVIEIICLIQKIEDYICIEFFDSDRNSDLFLLERLFDKVDDLVFFKDSSLKYKYVNSMYAEFLGKEKNQIINKRDNDLLPIEVARECLKSDIDALENGRNTVIEEVNGIFYRVIKKRIDDGIFTIAKDVSAEIRADKIAHTDKLTGLFNRRKFLKEIEEMYKTKTNKCFFAIIDLDNLRTLNNTFGHLKGDEYLKELAHVLKGTQGGEFFRIGGDEFAGLIRGDKKTVETVFETIYIKLQGLNLNPQLSISVGVREFDMNLSYTENYTLTDALLYKAKHTGRNRVCYY